jgi:hypothetical protein
MRVYIGNSGKIGRSILPLKDMKNLSDLLHSIGRNNQPLKVKEFTQTNRRREAERMSYEYKILRKLCPVLYERKKDPIVRIINNPYEHYRGNRETRPLWTGAFAKLVLDEETENVHRSLMDRYKRLRPGYKTSTSKSFLKEVRFKEQRELNALFEKNYLQLKCIETKINSRNRKDLGLCLTFRGILAYLFSEGESRKNVERKKEVREMDEKETRKAAEMEEARRRKWRGRIRQVIRNPYVVKEAPFLEHSDLLENSGFDVIGLLLQIGTELVDQLHIDTDNDRYLLRRATERYFAEFNRAFFYGLRGAVKKRYPMNMSYVKEKSAVSTLNEYRKKMALQRRVWTLNDLKEIDNTIRTSIELEDILKGNINEDSPI